jgi:malto-oligosyltrehalose synthase
VPDLRLPASSYRLQLTSDFGFAAAGDLADYLAGLGVTHVYLSPILQAVPGSRHGYDVIDHSRVSEDLGGEDAFREMVRRFRARGLGVIVDIVPNHMAVPTPESRNQQLWSVLAEGTGSAYAHWFDIDWAALDGRILLPILAGPVDDCLTDLRVADGPVLRYYDHVLPLRAGTEGLPMRELVDAQHYRLAYWRDAETLLNWRRFFDILSLIAVRVEDPDVFAATHAVVLRLFGEGLIDGLRVDHPDGLADPRGYFRRLAEATGGAWVVAEKILARDEELPADWECAGTTGYDALALVDGLFVDPDGAGPLAEAYAAFSGGARTTFAAVAETAKREVAEGLFGAELRRLTRLLPGTDAADAADAADVHQVLVELLASFGVYRAYVHPGEPPSEAASQAIRAAADSARRRLPDRLHATLDAVSAAALGAGPAEFVIRFQQTTGPVLAKGVEDTACYRWSRLVSLNEVGADPDRFGLTPAEFHARARHLASQWPATLTTLSTHDTKRQEDVRARLAVLAEHPGEWAREVAAWHEATGGGGVDPDTEYLIWQTLVGAWPIGGDRLEGYLTKAIREAKIRTSWLDPHEKYESAVLDLARRAPVDRIARFVHMISPDARVNSLGAKLVQLTMPGAADVYQGCELTGYSLVDPDNRRPVDFPRRHTLLAGIDDAPHADLDSEKLLVTTRALHCRRDNPAWFGSDYRPLTAHGPASGHVVAFARGGAVTVATRLPAGLRHKGGWQNTALPLTHTEWRDALTGATYTAGHLMLSELTRHLPVALLVAQRD